MTATCPSCQRHNAPHRITCLYCGAAMPNPTAPPPPKAVPANLDELVREAMRGGSVDAIKKAFQEAKAEAPAATVLPFPVARRPPGPQLVTTPPPAANPEALPAQLLALLDAAALARAAWAAADPDRTRDALLAAQDALAAAQAALPAPTLPPLPSPAVPGPLPVAAAPALLLPPIRHPLALVISPIGDPTLLPAVAQALEVDMATARTFANVRHTQVALRGGDSGPLERRRVALRGQGLRATLVARESLVREPLALSVLGRDGDRWRVVEAPLWGDEPDPTERPLGDLLAPGAITLAVLGEVETRTWRGAPEASRWQRARYTADQAPATRRVTVVDLHTASHILRLTDGLTVLRERDPLARALKEFIDVLETSFPGIHIEARRNCVAPSTGGDNARSTSGWPLWEEHTRMCRIHARE